ncbi:oxidoreductase [Luteitalea sp. TBR-22]|uniref:Gfo/Idh/MocA family protein n=1 Tax=Luteitalea sp. TBR-22 TaxID=2802971 RepID=UPI001AF61785|nr:Gfo/Idh/MocA family oxidoreductase [Luteitalea sp. TBR-22]BCS32761.1 oxidoreductase [Luteitalea sp. TBR-22]
MILRVGFTGGGNISDTHIRAVAEVPGLEAVAVCGSNAAKVGALAERYALAAAPSLAALLDAHAIDLVCIGSPSGVHADEIALAASRGCHVLTEKPLDITVERVDTAIAAVERAGVKLGVFYQDRCTPAFVEARDAIAAGRLGRVLLVDARVKWYRAPEYYRSAPWRGTPSLDGGGALINQAIHTVDLLLFLLGDVASVQARAATVLHDIRVEDTLVASLAFASGAIGTFQATTAAYPGYPRRVEITGTEGTLILEHDRIAGWDLKSGHVDGTTLTSATKSASTAVVADASPHRRVVEDFVDALGAGRRPACDAREGRRSVALVEALYESARTGTSVSLQPEGM